MDSETVIDAMTKAREALEAAGLVVEWREDGDGAYYLATNVTMDDLED